MGSRRGVKYCQNCGAMHDLNFTNTCSVCGQPIRTDEERRRIKTASNKVTFEKRKAPYVAKLNELKELQKDLTPLTNEEWNKAVRHFGGCAFCSSKDIDARIMLIKPQEGGKYNRGNVVPACQRCVGTGQRSKKGWIDTMHGRRERCEDKQALDRLGYMLDYLLEEAKND